MTARGGNNFTANRANLVFRTRRTRTKRMTVRRNALCTFLVTTGTRRSLYAFFRAGRSFRLNIFTPIMPESRDDFLHRQHFTAPGAMRAFGFPRRRTRCGNGLIRYLDMAESFDIPRLRFPAARTFGCLSAFLSTGGGLRLRVCAPIMTECRDFFLRLDDDVTAAAMDAFGFPRSRTRRRNCHIIHLDMTESFDVPRLRFPAARTFGCLDAVLRAGGGFRLNVCAPAMAKRGDLLLYLDDRIATRAMRTVRKARIRTGRRNGGIGHGSMPKRRNRSCRFGAAAAARCLFLAQRCTGRGLCLNICAVLMPQLRNDLLCLENFAADAAMTTFRHTVLCTSRRNRIIRYRRMTEGGCQLRTAFRAGLSGRAGSDGAGRMPRGGDHLIRRIVATRAGIIGVPADLGTRRRLRRMVLKVMPEGRSKLRTADRTSLRRYARRLGAGSMTLRHNLNIRRIIASGTSIISIPADLRASGRLRFMML